MDKKNDDGNKCESTTPRLCADDAECEWRLTDVRSFSANERNPGPPTFVEEVISVISDSDVEKDESDEEIKEDEYEKCNEEEDEESDEEEDEISNGEDDEEECVLARVKIEVNESEDEGAYGGSPQGAEAYDETIPEESVIPTIKEEIIEWEDDGVCGGTAQDVDTEDEEEGRLVELIQTRRDYIKPELDLQPSQTTDARFSPTNLEFTIVCADSIKVFSMMDGVPELQYTVTTSDPVTAFAYSSCGEKVYCVYEHSFIEYRKKRKSLLPKVQHSLFRSFATSLTVGAGFVIAGLVDGNIYVLSEEACQVKYIIRLDDGPIDSMAICDTMLYTTSGYSLLSLDLVKGKEGPKRKFVVDLPCGTVLGSWYVAGSARGELVLFDRETLGAHGTYKVFRNAGVSSIAAVGDNFVIMGFDNGYIKIYSLFPHKEIGIVGVLGRCVHQLSVSYDEQWLLAIDLLQGSQIFSLADLEYGGPPKKRSKQHHLPSSSFENNGSFFSNI